MTGARLREKPSPVYSLRQTDVVSSDEPDPIEEADPVDPTDLEEADAANDLAWAIPMVTAVPIAILFCVALIWAFGIDWVLISVLPFAVFVAVVSVIDLRELRIPNVFTRPGVVLALPLLALSLLSDHSAALSLGRAALAGLAMFAFYLVLRVIYPAGMGWGDIKLAPIIGAQLGFFGWIPAVRGLIAAYLIIGPVAIILLATRRAGMKTGLPFGPFMSAGAILALVLEAGHW